MEINVKYYLEMLDRFKQLFPWWADRITNCRPKNLNSIRVTLEDGELIDYNFNTDSMRRVSAIDRSIVKEISDDDYRNIFATNLAEIMKTRGFSQTELAAQTGLSTAIISKYLNGKAIPTIANLSRIAIVLDCHYDELLE